MVNVLYSAMSEKHLHSIALSGSNNHFHWFVAKPRKKWILPHLCCVHERNFKMAVGNTYVFLTVEKDVCVKKSPFLKIALCKHGAYSSTQNVQGQREDGPVQAHTDPLTGEAIHAGCRGSNATTPHWSAHRHPPLRASPQHLGLNERRVCLTLEFSAFFFCNSTISSAIKKQV